MKKLFKRVNPVKDTIEAFACSCSGCGCPCNCSSCRDIHPDLFIQAFGSNFLNISASNTASLTNIINSASGGFSGK